MNSEIIKRKKVNSERNSIVQYTIFELEFGWLVEDVLNGIIEREAFDIEVDIMVRYNTRVVTLIKSAVKRIDKELKVSAGR